MDKPFSIEIREKTRKSHRMVENAAFIRGFLRGYVNPLNYLQLITDYALVYEKMEEEILKTKAHCPVVEQLYFPQLFRASLLHQDIHFFTQALRIKRNIRPTPSAEIYRNHIGKIAETFPYLLAAHIYTRYLGDLSGGRILRKILSRALSLEGPEGLAFYEFPEIDSLPEFKAHFRSQLDSLQANTFQKEEIIGEANLVFHFNGGLFSELKGNSLHSAWRLLWPSANPFPKPQTI